jgi:hypothetical protein
MMLTYDHGNHAKKYSKYGWNSCKLNQNRNQHAIAQHIKTHIKKSIPNMLMLLIETNEFLTVFFDFPNRPQSRREFKWGPEPRKAMAK